MIRTFVAVEVSESVRSQAAELVRRLKPNPVKIGWVEPANMHITLKFLGEQTDEAVADICRAVQEGAATVEPFEFRCVGAGAFPNLERPRTLWLGVTDGLAQLQGLHAAIDAALARLRFPRDRQRFLPHLTIGRVREGGVGLRSLADGLRNLQDFAGGTTVVDEVTVFSSQLRPSGPVYEVLATASLAGI